MDLDIDQVLMYILKDPLFAVVNHIKFLYKIAARLPSNEILKVRIVGVAKEFMTIMAMFEHSQDFDFRVIPDAILEYGSYSQKASESWPLRFACSHAAACSTAAADIFTSSMQEGTHNADQETTNDLRFLIQDFKRISIEFQCVSEMIFGDRLADTHIVRRNIEKNIGPWRIFFHLPDQDPINNITMAGHNYLTHFDGVLSLDRLINIMSAVHQLKIAAVETREFIRLSGDIVNTDSVFNLVTDLTVIDSVLDPQFPMEIEASDTDSETDWVAFKLLSQMISHALDIVTMTFVVIGSFQLEGSMPHFYAYMRLRSVAFELGMISNSLNSLLTSLGRQQL
ncbi:hypothetical protein IHE45_19G073800 [Dioscorea alata]|uniref:Uncharacterized protein n=1 Tax=Dioscorea alata TaxID=55571 RepID=A0ACB7TZ62_DIOAL|nr:hypothetical protein IHE45_19G073800 [Dioscorea alata]